MKKYFLFSLLPFLLINSFLNTQEQFSIDINSGADGIVSRDQLDLFTFYDKSPSRRAVDYLIDLTLDEGFILGINNDFTPTITTEKIVGTGDESNSVYLSRDNSYAREAGSILLMGFNKLGSEDLSLTFYMSYFVKPLANMLNDSEAHDTQCGKSSLSVNILNTLQVGVDIIDRYSNYSFTAHCNILSVPESFSNSQVVLFDGAVTLFDTSLMSLFSTVGLTNDNQAYTTVNLLTPIPLVPYIFYDNFTGDNHSFLGATFSTMPLLGLDFLITPRFRLHDKTLQSFEATWEIFSLFSYISSQSSREKKIPHYRERSKNGEYNILSSMGPYIRQQYYNRYTGEKQNQTFIGFNMSQYMKNASMGNWKDMTISLNMLFEFNMTTKNVDLTAGLKYYF